MAKGNSSARTPAQTSDRVSRIAGRTLAGQKPTQSEVLSMAASLIRQDQHKGLRGK